MKKYTGLQRLKHFIKQKLQQSDHYLRLRYSPFFLKIWRSVRKEADVKLEQQADFYRQLLKGLQNKGALIIDIGANEGFTTALFVNNAHRVVAVEPAPANIKLLKNRFYHQPAVTIIPKAVSGHSGTGTLYLEEGTALHTLDSRWKNMLESDEYILKTTYKDSVIVETVTLRELIDEFGLPVFVKIDTEGYEQAVISSLQKAIPQLLFEAVLPVFLSETISCIEHLQGIDPHAVFNYAINDKLVLQNFVNAATLKKYLTSLNASVDIVCRMSNYSDFYEKTDLINPCS